MSTALTATVADPRTVRAAGIWDYISPSRLNLWLKCPLAFRLRYIDGVRSPVGTAQFLGKMVHHGLECFYRQRQQGIIISPSELTLCVLEEWERAATHDDVQF